MRGVVLEILDLPSFANVTDGALKTLLTNLVIEVFSFVAESERDKIRQRQKEGIAIAKRRGAYQGKSFQFSPQATGKNKVIYEKIIEGLNLHKPISVIAKESGVTRKTVYSVKKRINFPSENNVSKIPLANIYDDENSSY